MGPGSAGEGPRISREAAAGPGAPMEVSMMIFPAILLLPVVAAALALAALLATVQVAPTK